ncbi:methionyl-tRNA formyltransferase [Myxococcota bacterium]|nr:methionyl-tRNA formyltransferase [Myxococcota bacterium]MBU1429020.1 methionyl-tRNA formyltransferase [Myxococcota bacterium]MBU1898424.1 methionyl-tRNA formyltransferase [Myxococcota bacterium]
MQPRDLRVLFMGTPEFAQPTLARVAGMGCQLVGVVSQPARGQGRGRKVVQTPVGAWAEAHGAPLFQWPRLNHESYQTLKALAPDLCVVVAYGKILPQRYLDLPPHGCLNGHASVLPALRGAAPIQWSVIHGHREAGVSVMRMDKGMDTGDVGLILRTPIDPDETAGALHDRLKHVAADAMEAAILRLCQGALHFTPQDHTQATTAPMLRKEDGRVDWSADARAVHDLVRGVSPWPGAWVPEGDGALKIHATRVSDEGEGLPGAPGEIIGVEADGPRVRCGRGAVVLTQLQRPGRKITTGAGYLCGLRGWEGARFE